MKSNQLAIWLRWVALIIMGLFVAFMLFMGIGEMVGGEFSGIGHLLPALIGVGLLILAWKKPILGGFILLALGIISSLYFAGRLNLANLISLPVLIMGAPFLLSGLIFLVVGGLNRSNHLAQQPKDE